MGTGREYRSLITAALIGASSLTIPAAAQSPSPASSQPYPSRPIRMIVPWPPSGAVDILARGISPKLTEYLGQQLIIDNRPGANGIIGSEAAARAPADGYTLATENVTGHAINATFYTRMPFNSLRDFVHISTLAWVPNGIACLPSLPVKNVPELIALARKRPREMTYASFGIGSSSHMSGELFKTMARVEMLHVPYKGGLPAITDLLAGQVSIYYPVVPSVVQLTKAGRLRLIAVTGERRATALPQTPTVHESGLPGFIANNWFGVMAPAATPPEIVTRLNTEIVRAIQSPDVRDKLLPLAYDLQSMSPQEFTGMLRSETEKWAKVVKASGAKAD